MQTQGNGTVDVIVRSPVFFSELVLDPNYALLIEDNSQENICGVSSVTDDVTGSKSNSIIIIAVIVSVVGAAMLIALLLFFVYPKLHMYFKVRADVKDTELSSM